MAQLQYGHVYSVVPRFVYENTYYSSDFSNAFFHNVGWNDDMMHILGMIWIATPDINTCSRKNDFYSVWNVPRDFGGLTSHWNIQDNAFIELTSADLQHILPYRDKTDCDIQPLTKAELDTWWRNTHSETFTKAWQTAKAKYANSPIGKWHRPNEIAEYHTDLIKPIEWFRMSDSDFEYALKLCEHQERQKYSLDGVRSANWNNINNKRQVDER